MIYQIIIEIYKCKIEINKIINLKDQYKIKKMKIVVKIEEKDKDKDQKIQLQLKSQREIYKLLI